MTPRTWRDRLAVPTEPASVCEICRGTGDVPLDKLRYAGCRKWATWLDTWLTSRRCTCARGEELLAGDRYILAGKILDRLQKAPEGLTKREMLAGFVPYECCKSEFWMAMAILWDECLLIDTIVRRRLVYVVTPKGRSTQLRTPF